MGREQTENLLESALMSKGMEEIMYIIIVYGIIDYTCVTSYEQYKEDQKRINCGMRPLYRK